MLRRLVAQLPDLVPMLEAAGFAVVAVYAVGPQEEDLSPLATLEGLGFQPKATAIVLNEGLVEVGDAPAQAFARVFRHSVFRAAAERGAVPGRQSNYVRKCRLPDTILPRRRRPPPAPPGHPPEAPD